MAGEIYILRHGIEAIDPEPPGLSARGTARFRKEVRGLIWLGASVDLILSGTDPASHQSAVMLAGGFTPAPQVTDTRALGPEGSLEAAWQVVSDVDPGISLAVVGCEPVVGLLAARLIGATRPLPFKKGAVCRIDLDEGHQGGRLRWFLSPKILREMGRWA
jgi:phosphohistidine phosphatase SixA